MNIQIFPSGPYRTNAYVVTCKETGESAVIDPSPRSSSKIFVYCQDHKLIPKTIIITHSHWDHITDTAAVKEHFGAKVYIHPLDAGNLENPGSDGLPLMEPIKGVIPDQLVNEGDIISVGNLRFQVIHTPGHARGAICLYCKEENILFSGDTLFQGSIGNTSLPTSDPDDMWKSLPKLAKLPPETKVYPGHGPFTTIGNEPWLSNARDYFG